MGRGYKNWVFALFVVLFVVGVVAGCATTHGEQDVGEYKTSFEAVAHLTKTPVARLGRFGRPGGFQWMVDRDIPITINPDTTVLADVYRPRLDDRSPVVIISHGNASSKESHALQAERLASWGFHVVTAQLPNLGQWIDNGRVLGELATMISRYPMIIGRCADPRRVIIAGHSFGGSAAVVAAARGAPVKGLILLDPAVVSDGLLRELITVRVPMMLIGADESVFKSRRRGLFHDLTRAPFREISVRGATHNDAQYPSDDDRTWGFLNLSTSEERQEAFVRAMIASAISLAVDGSTNWAWRGLTAPKNRTVYFGAREKSGEFSN